VGCRPGSRKPLGEIRRSSKSAIRQHGAVRPYDEYEIVDPPAFIEIPLDRVRSHGRARVGLASHAGSPAAQSVNAGAGFARSFGSGMAQRSAGESVPAARALTAHAVASGDIANQDQGTRLARLNG